MSDKDKVGTMRHGLVVAASGAGGAAIPVGGCKLQPGEVRTSGKAP